MMTWEEAADAISDIDQGFDEGILAMTRQERRDYDLIAYKIGEEPFDYEPTFTEAELLEDLMDRCIPRAVVR